MKDRDAKLIAFYRAGSSMRETGAYFKISIERVRQILARLAPSDIRPPYDTRNNSSGLTSAERAYKERTAKNGRVSR